MQRSDLQARWKAQRGQTTTEYVLVIAVLVIALVWTSYTFLYPGFIEGVEGSNQRLEGYAERGHVGESEDGTR